ncbi:SemiSWEET family sugar transporter [Aquabacterium sp.]|uniref:SemiSWEET family sugar transporter n=1 Tax=Aquabacterium sp. TaxID=1872578 RepID=UPI0025C59AB0|nr:SemiSWEET transporter [Aquabacterium sp.]
MDPQTIEWIGTFAAALTTGSFLPQAWLTFRTRDVSGISLSMYSAFTSGVALWLLYGLSIGSWPVTIANAITLTLAMSILGMKLVYRERPARTPHGRQATALQA